MSEVPWLAIARRHIGLTEIPGRDTAPTIVRWLTDLKAWWRDDETPWCGVYVAACMRAAGVTLPKHWYRARDWLNWGVVLKLPTVGCVVVYERTGGGHVGLIVGQDQHGHLMTLGGNQGNRVSVAPFDRARALGFRWPAADAAILQADLLPIVNSNGMVSTQEG